MLSHLLCREERHHFSESEGGKTIPFAFEFMMAAAATTIYYKVIDNHCLHIAQNCINITTDYKAAIIH